MAKKDDELVSAPKPVAVEYDNVTQTIQTEAPEVEAYKLALMDAALQLVNAGVELPQQQIAELDALQVTAGELAEAGLGSYIPYIQSAQDSLTQASGMMEAAAGEIVPTLDAAVSGITSAAASSDPAVQAAYQDLLAQADRMYGYSQDVAAGTGAAARGALDVAGGVSTGAQGITSALESGLGATTERAYDVMGAVDPYLYQAGELALGSAQEGIASLAGTTAAYDPTMADPYMNAYVDQAVNAALQDIARQGEIMSQDVAASAVDAGAFGGSREAVAQAELDRAILDEMAATSAQMYADAYESSLAASQQAYEAQQARAQQAAALTGQLGAQGAATTTQAADVYGQLGMSAEQFAAANELAIAQTGMGLLELEAQTGISANQLAGDLALQAGQFNLASEQALTDQIMAGAALQSQQAQQEMSAEEAAAQLNLQGIQLYGDLGQGIGSLGMDMSTLGAQEQALAQSEQGFLFDLGSRFQAQEQAELEAQYQNLLAEKTQAYQDLAFLSDIYAGAPSSAMSTTFVNTADPSIGEQVLGAATTAAGLTLSAKEAGII